MLVIAVALVSMCLATAASANQSVGIGSNNTIVITVPCNQTRQGRAQPVAGRLLSGLCAAARLIPPIA